MSQIKTRFPPEPNGYLHIGHLKAILKNFTYASKHQGQCILRFDDTNPNHPYSKYTKPIQSDVDWILQAHGSNYCKITYTSDYFDQLFSIAQELISKDLAYVDSATTEVLRDLRFKGIATPDRSRSICDNLRLFKEMQEGLHKDGSLVLRLKISVDHPNTSLRDPVAYRIVLGANHHRTGTKWNVYPSYDFSHGLVDSLEEITHSFCTHEFYIRRDQYYWVIDQLGLFRPVVEEFNRLNIKDVLLSKRKILAAIERGKISGFDDPSLFTIAGLRNRGYPAEALIHFCQNYVEYSTSEGGIIEVHKFEWAVREYLNQYCLRRFAVKDPLKIIIKNFNSDHTVIRPDVADPSCKVGRQIPLNGVVYIDSCDFKLDPEKRYKRLAPGKEVRLRYYGIVRYISHDDLSVTVELLDKVKTKGAAIHWVSQPDQIVLEDGMLAENNLPVGEVIQFERLGYYRVVSSSEVRQVISLKNNYQP